MLFAFEMKNGKTRSYQLNIIPSKRALVANNNNNIRDIFCRRGIEFIAFLILFHSIQGIILHNSLSLVKRKTRIYWILAPRIINMTSRHLAHQPFILCAADYLFYGVTIKSQSVKIYNHFLPLSFFCLYASYVIHPPPHDCEKKSCIVDAKHGAGLSVFWWALAGFIKLKQLKTSSSAQTVTHLLFLTWKGTSSEKLLII